MSALITQETHRWAVYSNVYRDPQKTFVTEADALAARERMAATWPSRAFTVRKLSTPVRVRLGY